MPGGFPGSSNRVGYVPAAGFPDPGVGIERTPKLLPQPKINSQPKDTKNHKQQQSKTPLVCFFSSHIKTSKQKTAGKSSSCFNF